MQFDTLGVSVDGVCRVVCSTPKRASKVLAVLEFLCSGARVSGQQLEHVLGHITCCYMLHRCFLSLLGAVYKFIRQNCTRQRHVWPSAALELWRLRCLLPLVRANISIELSPTVTAVYSCREQTEHNFGVLFRHRADVE